MSNLEALIQQLITGITNGLIIALIALGYSMVYGIVELINFAHGDLFMLGCFLALTIVGVFFTGTDNITLVSSLKLFAILLVCVPLFCATLNYMIDKFAYKPIRSAPKLVPLVSAIGVSFILVNIGLFWGGLPLDVFNMGTSASAPKDFPMLLPFDNLLGESSNIFISWREILVVLITLPLLLIFAGVVRYTKIGIAMRAVAQNPKAASLMGIDSNKTISFAFIVGGALAGVASVVYCFYNNTVYYQMGYRAGIDAFSAAVFGGIGSLPGACIGAILIGIIRAMSDQYIGTNWTNVAVFLVLIAVLVVRPQGILGAKIREKL